MALSYSTFPEIQSSLDKVEELMLSQADNYHPELKAALSVILSSGGKRIRPTIILLIGSMLKARKELLIPLATAIELLHTATLVHDDLIDSSLLRRGVPTLNSKWSPAATVLTGDFVFASAARMATQTNSLKVMELFSRTLMTIVNGEINQLFSSRCVIDVDDYFNRIYAKTASLFETSAYSAALISDVDSHQADLLRKFGYELGMAFQIVDDILDYVGNPSTVGKPVGGDLRQGLITLPLIYFIDQHPDSPTIQPLIVGKCIQNEEEVQNLVENVASSEALIKAQKEANKFAGRAKNHLAKFPASPERTALIEIANYIVDRNK